MEESKSFNFAFIVGGGFFDYQMYSNKQSGNFRTCMLRRVVTLYQFEEEILFMNSGRTKVCCVVELEEMG